MRLDGYGYSLETFTDDDLTDEYVAWLNDPEINAFLEVRHEHQTRETVAAYIAGLRSRHGCELFAVKDTASGRHVGNVAITRFDPESGIATYGIMIGDEEHLKRGFAGGEATILVIDFIFSHREITAIEGSALVGNAPALTLMRRVGFKEVPGTATAAVSGAFRLSKDDWLKIRRRFVR